METYESWRRRQRRRQIAKDILVNSLAAIVMGVLFYAWIIICACW